MTSEDPTTSGAAATGATADTNFSVSEGDERGEHSAGHAARRQ